ncbi:GyrI-like domain-containing protein [Metabacillus niabensis]|uniref:GyrI-like domain-containing protein n=1 Tax=Metabacillus niabensis TaxID=324854 RepID=UPI001CF9AF5A|nr:GyrI-like domain-containing protein [Metabacillus niabensis]
MPKEKPELLKVPRQNFLMITGKGNPNEDVFSRKVEVLYSLAYAIKMMPKQGFTPEGYYDYTVYPLEGIWSLTEKGIQLDELNKDELLYTNMIRQPDFVNVEIVEKAFEQVRKKKPTPLLDEVTFESMEDGLTVQMLHIGPYDNEPQTFEKIDEFSNKHHLERISFDHREIYLSDVRKVKPAKLKTVLRYKVKSKN